MRRWHKYINKVPLEHRAKTDGFGVMGLMETSWRRRHWLWTLKGLGLQHAAITRKRPSRRENGTSNGLGVRKCGSRGAVTKEGIQLETWVPVRSQRCSDAPPGKLDFTMQFRGLTLCPLLGFPRATLLASHLIPRSGLPWGRWERGKTHLILSPAT